MVRIGAIGYGDIAQRSHFPELLQLRDRARLVAIAGRNEARMAECARRFGIPRYYTNPADLLASDEVDAVMVLTPPGAHAEWAVRAVEAGKHVLLEKPMVRTMDEAHRILAAVEKRPVVFFPLPYVASAAYDTLRELIAAGAIGRVTSIECNKSHRGPTHADWFYRKEIAGGGVLFDLGIYAFGAIAYVFGPATHVSALCTRLFETRTMDDGRVIRPDVEDSALVSLRLHDGTAAVINANFNGYLTHHDTRSRMIVFGREGMIHFGVPGAGMYIHRVDDRYDDLPVDPEPVSFDGYLCRRVIVKKEGRTASILEHFLHLIERGDTSTLPLKQQIHVMEIMLTAYECGGLDDARRLQTTF
ncbi:MAG TPA: Gfo/Idh/MocA family oxidoreductase [Limnochordia bacterium]